MDSDDGFVTVDGGTVSTKEPIVEFHEQVARVPFRVGYSGELRANWQWNGNGLLRLRLGQQGRYSVRRSSRDAIRVATLALYRTIGRSLAGQRIPIERIDGNDIYIRIEEPVEVKA